MTLGNCVLVPVPADLFLERHRVLVAAIEEMKSMPMRKAGGDVEANHARADDILCAMLRAYGAGELVDAFEALEKWYA